MSGLLKKSPSAIRYTN